MKINLGKKEIIHFIGIGGIGMSGLALIMNQLGFKIQGSDISINKSIERLKKCEIKIFTKHKISNLKKANIVVISSAIKNNNIELNAAKKKDLPSDSSDSSTHHSLFPSLAELLIELITPPFIIVGSNFALEKTLAINEVVVVFP